jgi:hypothetical protein
MPYKGSNAEWLHNMCLYDLLCRMQENAEERAKKQPVICVLSYIENANPLFRCAGYAHSGKHDCRSCIADWLNERCE